MLLNVISNSNGAKFRVTLTFKIQKIKEKKIEKEEGRILFPLTAS